MILDKHQTGEVQVCEPIKCYKLRGITYVPTYFDPTLYVGPGYPRFTDKEWTANELQLQGAKAVIEMLWPRPRKARGQA